MDYENPIAMDISFFNMMLRLWNRHVPNPPFIIDAHILHEETVIMENNLYIRMIGLLNQYIVDDDNGGFSDTEWSEADTIVDDSD
jgi:hypothetical protein